MSFNEGFSTQGIPYVTGSDGQILTIVDGQWVAGDGLGSVVSSVYTSGSIIGNGTVDNKIRLNNIVTVDNLYVNQTASIAHLDYIYQQSLVVGDKYITLMSGANDHSLMDGSGILWGSGSTDPTTGEQGSVAHIVYRNNNRDQLEVYPGLYVSGNITASSGINSSLTGSLFANTSSVIDVSSSIAAFRITQHGTGDSILVEDTQSVDTTPFVVKNDGKVGIGTQSPVSTVQIVGSLIQGLSAQTEIGVGAHAQGLNTLASGDYSHAEGDSTEAYGTGSHAEGVFTEASGSASHAEGLRTTSGPYSHAEGDTTVANGLAAHAEGGMTLANWTYTHAEGYLTTASFLGGHSEGYRTIASGNYVHAEGRDTVGVGYASHVEGLRTYTSGSYAHAEGINTTASAEGAHSEGYGTIATGTYAHAQGYQTIASGTYSHAAGFRTIARGEGSYAFGQRSLASGVASRAVGINTTASAAAAHAEGYSTVASQIGSHAEGTGSVASGQYSHAEGFMTLANGYAARSVGTYTTASGESSYSEGRSARASGNYSHAEAIFTVAAGPGSHAEGYYSTASGWYSHAEGFNSNTIGTSSFANGLYTVASGNFQSVVGSCNSGSESALFLVGNGTYDLNLTTEPYSAYNIVRSNILEAYQNRVVISGSLSITGGFQTPIKKITINGSNYQFVTGSDFTVLFSGSALTGTLPAASQATGFMFNAKNLTTNRLFITASSGMIEGSNLGISWNSKASYTFQSDGTDWYII